MAKTRILLPKIKIKVVISSQRLSNMVCSSRIPNRISLCQINRSSHNNRGELNGLHSNTLRSEVYTK